MKTKDEIHLKMAKVAAELSKDKNTQVGCIIVDVDGRVVSTGRNGAPSGVDDDKVPYSRDVEALAYLQDGNIKKFRSNKYPFMIHSEPNAIMFADRERLKGATIFVNFLPCPNCALLIAQSGITRVVIPDAGPVVKSTADVPDTIHQSKYIFALKGITLQEGNEVIDLAVL